MRAQRLRHLAVVTTLILSTLSPAAARAQFPIAESFTGSSASGWSLKGSAVLTANGHGDAAGAGWLRLTDATADRAGTAYYDTAFPSTYGIVATFDYADYGGSHADGFSFFLIDGAVATPTVGSSGGPLGYAAKVDSTGPTYSCTTGPQLVRSLNGTPLAGVTGGYVGIGFDEYGNFSNCEAGYASPGLRPQAVAIRGSGTSGTGSQTDFRYLTGVTVTPAFTIDGVERAAARRVRISIISQKITVELDLTGTGQAYQTLISGYDLAIAPDQGPMPATFKMGISGSTGGSTNTHEIRNVRIEKPVRLTLAQTASPAGTMLVGDTLTYTITLANDATNDATGTSIVDHVPAGLTGVHWACTATGGASLPAMSGAGDLVVASATLPRSSSLTCVVTGTAAEAALGTTLTNVVDVTPPLGSANLLSSKANTAVLVAYPTDAALASSLPSTVFGQATQLTATVVTVPSSSHTPAGTVTFLDGATTLGAAAVDGAGVARLTVSGLAVGSHSLQASFTGTSSYLPSQSPLVSQAVAKADTSTALTTSGTVELGRPVTLTAQVAAVAPGGLVPDGTVAFYDGATLLGSATLDGTGRASFTTSAIPFGDRSLTACYGGSAGYLGSTSAVVLQPITAASTGTALTARPGAPAYGQPVTLSAAVTSVTLAAGIPTGQVGFYDGAAPLGTATLDATGTAQLVLLLPAAGLHGYSAVFLGGVGYAGSASGSVPLTVSPAPTAITLAASVNPSVAGQPVTWTVTVTAAPAAGVPGGKVELRDAGALLATADLAAGGATFTLSSLAAGTHPLTAGYLGTASYAASGPVALSQRVNKASTTTTVTAPASATTFGQAATFTATVAPVAPGAGTPTGTVTFWDGSGSLGSATLSGGVAHLTTAALAAATHTVRASYAGDGSFTGSDGTATHRVAAAATATALRAGPDPSAFGQLVTLTATVTTAAEAGTATGAVTFRDGATVLGTAALDATGVATLETATLAVGGQRFTATYAGDGDRAGSTSPVVDHTVAAASTAVAVSSSLPTSTFGDEVAFTATVSPVFPGAGEPTGTVTFLVDGAPVGTGTLSGGVATFRTLALPAGVLEVTATYAGDGSFAASASPAVAQVVGKAAATVSLASSANPVALGEPLTLTATVAGPLGAPGGTVTFRDGATVLCAAVPLSGGTATCAAALAVGAHALTAAASGDADHAPGTSAILTQAVNPAPSATAVSAAPGASVYGQAVTLTATVRPAGAGAGLATGTITFQDGGAAIGTAPLDGAGIASLAVSTAAVGGHAVTATYGGDARYLASSSAAPASFTVSVASTATGLAASAPALEAGQPFTLTATVAVIAPGAGSPGGTVTFRDGTTTLGTGAVGAGGVATLAVSGLGAGAHPLTAEYGGDGHLAGSTSAAVVVTVSVAATATTAAAAKNPVVYGEPVALTVQVAVPGPGSGTPAGSVTVEEAGTVLGTGVLSAGAAAVTVTGLEPGAHALVARFPGDAGLGASASAPLALRVDPAATQVTLVAGPSPVGHGEAATLTATVAAVAPGGGVPAGTVSFSDGGAALGTATLDGAGRATFTTRALAIGAHALTATYAGGARHLGATSAPAALTVERDAVTVAVASSRNPSRHGRQVTFTVTVAAGGGTPDGAVTLRDGGAALAELTLSGGAATFTTRDLSRGTHTITAAYAGSTTFAPGEGTLPGGEVIENAPPVAGAGTALALGPGGALRARLPAPATAHPAAGTVELWLTAGWQQPEDVGPAPSILVLGPAGAPRLALGLSPDRRTLGVTLGASSTSVPVALDDGRWHHLAVASDGQESRVLVDGAAVASLEGGLGAGEPGAPGELVLGEGFVGQVDELRVWSSARTAEALDADRWRILRGDEAGLEGLWRFDEGSGAELFDAGPAHLDGAAELDEGGQAWVASTAWAHRTLPSDHTLRLDAGYDPDGDPVTVTLGEAPALGTLRRDADRLRYDAPPEGAGLARLAWTVSDGNADAAGTADVEVIGPLACQAVTSCPSGDLCLSGFCAEPAKVVARSGAGCGAGPAGSSAPWALLALLLLAVPRLRRAPALRRTARSTRTGVALLLLLAAPAARAQTPAGFALQTLEPSPPGDRFFSLPDADTGGKLRPSVALTGSWTDRPLVLKQGGHEVPGGHIVDRSVWVWGQASLALLDRVVVDAAIPMALAQQGQKPISSLARVSASSLGDLRLGARAGLPLPLPLHLALGLDVWLPTGKRAGFASDGAARALPKALASGELGDVVWAAELGVLVRRDADLGVLTRTGSAFHYAAGLGYRFGPLQIAGELYGRKQFRGTAASPAEVLLGARWAIGELAVGAAAGTALNDAPGAAPLRVVANVTWQPETTRR
jgi:uncharacterized repeat protein (TIGR01451 family)